MSPAWPLEAHRSLPSTMEEARRRALEGAPEGTTVVAEQQTQGRGRRGRQWFSKARAGVFLTTLLRPYGIFDAGVLGTLGLVAGVAVAQALRQLNIADIWLKWPNDVMHGERKLAGILMEAEGLMSPAPWVLVGIGLNIVGREALGLQSSAADPLQQDVQQRYIGVQNLCPTVTYDAALSALLQHLEACYHTWRKHGPAPLLKSWQGFDGLRNCLVRAEVAGAAIEGVALGINSMGHLELQTNLGVVTVAAGEVQRVRAVG